MNKERRKALTEITGELSGLKGRLEELQAEEQDYYDNMPENMQAGEKGEAASAAADAIQSAADALDDVISSIEEASGA